MNKVEVEVEDQFPTIISYLKGAFKKPINYAEIKLDKKLIEKQGDKGIQKNLSQYFGKK